MSFKTILAKLGMALVLASLFCVNACSKAEDGNTVWIYTSMFPETIALFEKALQAKYPDIKVKWFQNGSENINAKLAIEEQAGAVKADIILTADIFWFRKKADEGFFEPHKPELDYEIPAAFHDKDWRFTVPRISAMLIGYNTKFVTAEDAPKSFKELADPKWKSKVTSGSPLESGTNYTLMSNLAYRYGYDFLKKLRTNDLMSAGGNSAVMQRMVTGERPVGMILLESILNTRKTNPNIAFVYPSDGAIICPGPMGLVKTSKNMAAAKKVYDFFLSHEGQKISVNGLLHVPDPTAGFPAGSLSLSDMMSTSFDMSEKFFEFVKKEESEFKTKYSDIMY